EEEEEAGDEEAEAEEDVSEAGDEEEAEAEAPKKPKKAPAKPRPRSRAAKHQRMKYVWAVFNNSHQCVAKFDYPKRKEAEEHAAKLSTDKKQTFFVQPVKEAIEEKKEA